MNSERLKKSNRDWRMVHSEQMREYHRTYRLVHSEQVKAYKKKYRLAHKEQIKTSDKSYKLIHSEQIKTSQGAWYLANKEQRSTHAKTYRQTPGGKAVDKKVKSKRRQLGFVPLNDWFEGSEGHHIDIERVIYIPKAMHQLNRHSLSASRNMEIINSMAFEFLAH